MISSLSNSLMRVTLFWYVIGILVMFFGHPDWAEAGYLRTMRLLPWVPEIELDGLSTAAKVQWAMISYWTLPVAILWVVALLFGAGLSEIKCQMAKRGQLQNLKPSGEFGGVTIAHYSMGQLPLATTPRLEGSRISLTKGDAKRGEGFVELKGAVAEAAKLLNPAERQLCEELLQLLSASPNHYAGLGHGVGLLAHTLNVVSQAAAKCTSEFRMPLIAALAHDVGKLVTFVPDGEGGWKRKGLHSRESARILATLPGYRALPELHQDALLLAVKYDHNPNKMPQLRGNSESRLLALRVISALSQADRAATAEEKDRHLERLKPEDLLFQDFCAFLREAPIATRGKKGTANMVNNPPDNDFIFIYEAAWREAAVRRLPPEVAAALDLNRRDSGKLAKYTRILAERLRKEGLLLEQHGEMATSEKNPLWDIQSGTGEKAVVFRGVLALRADPLWGKLNYRLSVKSPFPVTILAPNADAEGKVNSAPRADATAGSGVPEVNDGMRLDISSPDALAALGLAPASAGEAAAPARNPKTRQRFPSAPQTASQDSVFGLLPAAPAAPPAVPPSAAKAPVPEEITATATPAPAATPAPVVEPEQTESLKVTPVSVADAHTAPSEPEPNKKVAPDTVSAAVPASAPDAAPATSASPPAVRAPKPEKAPATASPAPATPKEREKSTLNPRELSRTEKKAGLAIATAEDVAKYPHLKVGDRFYNESSPDVIQGRYVVGRKFKEDNTIVLSERGPRRSTKQFK